MSDTTDQADFDICARLERVRARIRLACEQAGREPDSVRLLAVSKTKPVSAVKAALACGQTAFGESYLQDARQKLAAHWPDGLEWHFIGPIQSNKTREIAAAFDWAHAIDREKIARRLNDQRPAGYAPLNVCLQVNISAEASKSGLRPDDLPGVALRVAEMPRLRLRGLMCIPGRTTVRAEQAMPFARMRALRDRLADEEGIALDTLSMGMSGDLEAAIAEGATMVRVGTDIFGPRVS